MGTIAHDVPFQRSASANDCVCVPAEPTAKHELLLAHDTDDRPLTVVPPGNGTLTSDHFLPFHCFAIA